MRRDPAHDLDTIGHYHRNLRAALPDATRRCNDLARGHYLASPAIDSSGPAGGTHSDPTARRALTSDGIVADQRELDRRLRQIIADLDWLDRFAARYPATRVGDTTVPDPPTCASCARLGHTADPHVHAPRIDGVPNQPLCRRCWEWARTAGAWPALDLLEEYHRTGRMRIRVTTSKESRHST